MPIKIFSFFIFCFIYNTNAFGSNDSADQLVSKFTQECHQLQQANNHQLKNKKFLYEHSKAISDIDQELRQKALPYIQDKSHPLMVKIKKLNTVPVPAIHKILKANGGWLKLSVFGNDLNEMIWLLIQHSENIPLQEKAVKALKKYAAQKEAYWKHYAYLYDRLAMNKKELQLYGTQTSYDETQKAYVLYKTHKLDTLDQCRKEMGLEPSADYLKSLNEFYEVG